MVIEPHIVHAAHAIETHKQIETHFREPLFCQGITAFTILTAVSFAIFVTLVTNLEGNTCNPLPHVAHDIWTDGACKMPLCNPK